MPEYRMLCREDLTSDLLNSFQRRQEVTHCWRRENGSWQIRPVAFVDDWTQQDRDFVIWCMGEIQKSGGMTAGAFLDGQLKGLAAVSAEPLGSRGQYLELSGLWVSQDQRGRGIGRRLVELAKAFAREKGGEKLFVSSHPSVETQAFYQAMGFTEAEETSATHAQREPLACQIECVLGNTPFLNEEEI